MGSDDPGKQTTALTSATTTQVGPVRSPAADATPFTATTGDEQKQLPVEKSEAASKTPVEVSAPVEEVTEEKSNAGTSTIPAAVEKASDERYTQDGVTERVRETERERVRDRPKTR